MTSLFTYEENRVWQISNLLSYDESLNYIQQGEKLGFKPAPLTLASNLQTTDAQDIRNNYRADWESEEEADLLWNKIKQYVPKLASDLADCAESGEGFEVVGLNPFIKFYRYAPGEHFAPHKDGISERPLKVEPIPDDDDYGLATEEKSFLTCLFYLNTVPNGSGETKFLTKEENGSFTLRFAVRPQQGACLLFTQRQWHEGAELRNEPNMYKYVLRSDVMYRRQFKLKKQVRMTGELPSSWPRYCNIL